MAKKKAPRTSKAKRAKSKSSRAKSAKPAKSTKAKKKVVRKTTAKKAKTPKKTKRPAALKPKAPAVAPSPVPKPAPMRPAVTTPAPPPRPSPPAAGPREEAVGVITHYFSHLMVAVVDVNKGSLNLGDKIHVKGHTTDFSQNVESIEVDHQPVMRADVGQSFGLKVRDHVREHDVVYKVLP